MGIRTLCYTTTKEKNFVGKMGIRTTCYTTMKGQIMLVKWVSEHHAILQWKNKTMYALSCNFSQVIPIFFNFKGAHFCNNKTKLYYNIRTLSF